MTCRSRLIANRSPFSIRVVTRGVQQKRDWSGTEIVGGIGERVRRGGVLIGIVVLLGSSLLVENAFAGGTKHSGATQTGKRSTDDPTPRDFNSSTEFMPSDPSHAKVEFVYAIPSDVNASACASGQAEVRARANAMNSYLSRMELGYQLRYAEDAKGQTLVDCLNLSQSSADLSSASGATLELYDSIESQVHQIPGYDPLTLYAVIVDGQCPVASGWFRGMEVGHDVVAICENYDTGSLRGVSALEAITLRNIFWDTENPSSAFVTGYTPGGVAVPGLIANDPNDLLSISALNQTQYSDWPYENLSIGDYFKSTPGHNSFDRSPLAEWEVRLEETGKGTISYVQVEADGTKQPVAPGDGDYFQAGTHLEALATPGRGYKSAGFTGEVRSTANTVDLGTVDHLIDETAVFTPLAVPAARYRLVVRATRVRVRGNGIDCPGRCTTTVTAGSAVRLSAEPNRRGARVRWMGCNEVNRDACIVRVVANRHVVVTATR